LTDFYEKKIQRKNVKSLSTAPSCNQEDWFKMSKNTLCSHQSKEQNVQQTIHWSYQCNQTRTPPETRKTVKYIVKQAKARYQEQFANDTSAKRWVKNPKVWALSTGCYSHHTQPTAMKMKLPNGNLAENDKARVDIPAILSMIPKKKTMSKLGNPPIRTEFDTEIKNMTNGKKPPANPKSMLNPLK
jgi:hypothetical protein